MLIAIAFMFLCCFLLVPVVGGALYMAFDGDIRRGRGELLWASGDVPPAEYLEQQAALKAGAALAPAVEEQAVTATPQPQIA